MFSWAQTFPSGAIIPPGSRVKFGIDPTLDRLHLGHFVPLRLAAHFARSGHPVTIVLGTFTAQLGDPSGKEKTRPMLSREQTKDNSRAIRDQIRKLMPQGWVKEGMSFTGGIWENHSLHGGTSLIDFLTLASKFTVGHMMSRDAFQKRTEEGNSVALHELLVPICQGMDSVFLETEVEIGGQDQLFNFQVTRKLQELHNQPPQICIMTPILTGTDGRKMSKSLGNCIFLDEPPQDIFGKIMSIPDSVMEEWLPLFCGPATLSETNPMARKKGLAFSILSEISGTAVAAGGLEHFEKTVQKKELPENIPTISASTLMDLVVKLRSCSRSEARRIISQNGVTIDGQQVVADTQVRAGQIVRVGKRHFCRVTEDREASHSGEVTNAARSG